MAESGRWQRIAQPATGPERDDASMQLRFDSLASLQPQILVARPGAIRCYHNRSATRGATVPVPPCSCGTRGPGRGTRRGPAKSARF